MFIARIRVLSHPFDLLWALNNFFIVLAMNSSPRNSLPLTISSDCLSPHTEGIVENPPMEGLTHDLIINCGGNSRAGHSRSDGKSDISLIRTKAAAIPFINEYESRQEVLTVDKCEVNDPIKKWQWKGNEFYTLYKDLIVSKVIKAKIDVKSKRGKEDNFNSLLINNQISECEKTRLKEIDRGILRELNASAKRWSADMMLWKPAEYEERFKLPVKDGLKSIITLFLLRNSDPLEENNDAFIFQEVKILKKVDCLKIFLSLAKELDHLASADDSALKYFPLQKWFRFIFEVILFIKNQLYLSQATIFKTIEDENCKTLIAQYINDFFLLNNSISWELNIKIYILKGFSDWPNQEISQLLDNEGWKILESIYIKKESTQNQEYMKDKEFNTLILTFHELDSLKNKTIIKEKINIILSKCFEIIKRFSTEVPHQQIQREIHQMNLIYKTMSFIFNYYKEYGPKIYFESEFNKTTQDKFKLFEETIGLISIIIKIVNRRASMSKFHHSFFAKFPGENQNFLDDLSFIRNLQGLNTKEIPYSPDFYFLNADIAKINPLNKKDLKKFSKKLESNIVFGNEDNILSELNEQCLFLHERWITQIKILKELLGDDSNDKFVKSIEVYINWATDLLSKIDNYLLQNHREIHHTSII